MKICVYSVHIVIIIIIIIIDIIIIIIAFGLVLKTAVTPFRHFDFSRLAQILHGENSKLK